MKHYLAVFLGSTTGEAMKQWDMMDAKFRQQREHEGMLAWGRWAEKYKDNIVEVGSPLGKTMIANKQGIANTKNLMTAYTVVQANTHEEAAKMFENHPHFSIFPGESVEIMECLPLPKM